MKIEKRKNGRTLFQMKPNFGHYIVARMSHNGAPIFARIPRRHKNAVDAETEATRLCLMYPNSPFGYYQFIGKVVGSPVNKDLTRFVTIGEFVDEMHKDAQELDINDFHLKYGGTPQELGVTDGTAQAACTPTQEAQAQSNEGRVGGGSQLREASSKVGQDAEVCVREARESQEESRTSGPGSIGSLYDEVYRTFRKNQEIGRGINGAKKDPTVHGGQDEGCRANA